MIGVIVALASVPAVQVDVRPMNCIAINRDGSVERFVLSANKQGALRFGPLDGAWSRSIDGGAMLSANTSGSRAVLTSAGTIYSVAIKSVSGGVDGAHLNIGEAKAGVRGSVVTVATGSCTIAQINEQSLKDLPVRGKIDEEVGPFHPPLGLHGNWPMRCALIGISGRHDLEAALTIDGYNATLRLYGAPWIDLKIGDIALIPIFVSHDGAGFEGKRRIVGTASSFKTQFDAPVIVDFNFDYFDEGEEEPEADLSLVLPHGVNKSMYSGMCVWTKSVSTGKQI